MSVNVREALRLMQAKQWAAALDGIDKSLPRTRADPTLLMCRAQCLMVMGRPFDAFAAAQAAEAGGASNAGIADAAGTLYSNGNDHRRAPGFL